MVLHELSSFDISQIVSNLGSFKDSPGEIACIKCVPQLYASLLILLRLTVALLSEQT